MAQGEEPAAVFTVLWTFFFIGGQAIFFWCSSGGVHVEN